MRKKKDVCVGKLGRLHFRKGYYSYVGTACGTGGFKRVARHFNVASGKNKIRKWHIDYLLPHSEVACAILIPTNDDIECTIAAALASSFDGIQDFGCSDCRCNTHLFFSDIDIKGSIIDICKTITGNESIIMDTNIQE
ncbi:MAG: GIY-YIG nuclease family protein [Candidatus Methanoperedens sp.]|nr:GIY-YIG nuclease family protein [Candidatus Methanoperedens sp.]